MSGPLHRAFNTVAGLGSEAYAHHQNKKKNSTHATHAVDQSVEDPTDPAFAGQASPSNPLPNEASDEDDWNADEHAAHDTATASCVPKGKAGGPPSIEQIVTAFLATYSPHPTGHMLPCPVIIPQKRPGNKTRGFVRAYAPVLEAVGINERVWMDFMRSFEESIKTSPVFTAVNVAVQGVGMVGNFVPSAAIQASVTAITTTNIAAQRVYQRGRYNDFLAQMNAKFFQPLGLFTLIMTYDPQSNAASQPFDLSEAVAKAETGEAATGLTAKWKTFKGVTGATKGEARMPQAAELVYRDTDDGTAAGESIWKRSNAFVGNYMDKRAQAQYANQNSGTALAMKPQFESSHGAMGTDTVSRRDRLRQRIDGRGGNYGQAATGQPAEPQSMLARHRQDGGPLSSMITAASGGKLQGRDARPLNIVKRTVKPGVMYLMVTQMPSNEQIEAAREQLELH